MEALASFLAAVMTIPIVVPFGTFISIYFFLIWKKKSKKDAATYAVNITTFFLIVAVIMMHGLIKEPESLGAIWWVILFFLMTGGLIGWLQFKVKGRMDVPKILRAVWRLAFVCFTIMYFFLFFTGINHFLQLT
jgi:hypothetical protein